MGRIKKMTPEERERVMSILRVPPDTTLPDRLMKVIQYTSLSFRGLLEKWLHQEEASIEAAKLAKDEILRQVETRIDILEKKVLRLEGKRVRWEDRDKVEFKRMLVSEILSFRKAGKTFKQIADLFNEENTPTLSGRGKWSTASLTRLLYAKKK
jgi:hypothetical protein